MYQVIIFLDETRDRSYYHSYTISNDKTLGNIECSELPPYQDYNKARSCYWDSESETWIFDEEKYTETLSIIKAEEEARKEAELIAAFTPTVLELAEASIETAQAVSDVAEAIDVLAEMLVMVDERLAMLEENFEEV